MGIKYKEKRKKERKQVSFHIFISSRLSNHSALVDYDLSLSFSYKQEQNHVLTGDN
jgi:hypothetical protein